MEKEVLELVEAAGKQSDEHKCVKALIRLKHLPITLEVLANSNAGKFVKSLTKHSSKAIQVLASDVIVTWKRQLVKQQTKKSATNYSVNCNNDQVLKIKKKSLLKADSIPKCNDVKRNKMREEIFEALCLVFDEVKEDMLCQVNSCDPIAIAVSVESALFAKWGSADNKCRHKYRSLLFNIKDPKNPDFRRKILVGEIKADQVSELSATDMASEKRKDENEDIKARALMKCIVKKDEVEFTTTEFKCGKCGMRKTTYYQIQTRSADEPMTTFVTCTNCGKRWKFC